MKNNYRISLTEEEIDRLNEGEAIYIQIEGATIELSKFKNGEEYDNK